MAEQRLRKLWRDVHLWIGISLVIVFVPLGLTGSWLVYDEPLDQLLHPLRYQAHGALADLPPSRYLDAAGRAFGNRARPSQLRLPEKPGGPVVVASATGLTAWIDPGSARVVDTGDPRRELRGVIHQLHSNLFLAQTGRRIVGVLGLAMLVSGLTGVILWWPRGNNLIKALRWRRSPMVWSNLHHALGFWICVPLVALSFTGAAIAFPEAVGWASGVHARTSPGRGQHGMVPAPLDHPRLSADQALAAAQPVLKTAPVEQIQLPTATDPHPAWKITAQGEHGALLVAVDDATGAAKARPQTDPSHGPPFADPVMRLIRNIHQGRDMAALWRAIICLAGLSPALLGLSGVIIWLRRNRVRGAV